MPFLLMVIIILSNTANTSLDDFAARIAEKIVD